MFKRIIMVVLTLFFINYIFGCTKIVKIRMDGMEVLPEKIIEAILVDGTVIKFDSEGGKYQSWNDVIVGFDNEANYVEVPASDVLYVKVKRTSVGGTILAVVGVLLVATLAAVAIIAATKESCPFVYSFDGEQYVFDAEPLGGAICKALERTEYSRLEFLNNSGGKYKLLLRNEVEEIQYLDELKLAIVDHNPGDQIVADYYGNLYTISTPISPISATDENNNSLIKFLEKRDGIFWQSQLPRNDSQMPDEFRHQLTFKFPKPANVSAVNLIVNAGTALWGSNMIREMLQLRGDGVDAWYEDVNAGGAKAIELFHFNLREELYMLKTYVKRDNDWAIRGIIPGGGPLITEDRLIDIDLTDISPDTLVIRINPPRGFWTLDYIAVEYDQCPQPQSRELLPVESRDMFGKDIGPLLSEKDEKYFIMPEIEDWATVEFNVPEKPDGKERTIFLKSTGWYEIQTDKTQPEKKELVDKLLKTPGEIVKYSLEEYLKWHEFMLKNN